MYKKIKAKDAIAASILDLAKKKDFSKITVNQIVENCGFSRKTFYNNFDSKYDAVIYIFYSKSTEIAEDQSSDLYWSTKLSQIYRFMYDNKYLFGKNWPAEDFERLATNIEKTVDNFYYHVFCQKYGESNIPKELLFWNRYNSYGASMIIFNWLQGKIQMSPEELGKQLNKVLPLELRQLLDDHSGN